MKLRIKGNCVRVRLTRSEVARLAAGQQLQQITEFSADSRLVSSIEIVRDVSAPQANYENNRIALLLPGDLVKQWAASDQVSIEAAQPIGIGQQLTILIEKDFECIHSRAEDESDAYPNPRRSP